MSTRKIVECQKTVRRELDKKFDPSESSDVWDLISKSAGLETGLGGVPIQEQRHLITSWAGVSTGVVVFVKMLIKEHDAEVRRIRAEYTDSIDRADNATKLTEDKAEAQKVSMASRSLMHISNESERALVAEEFAS